MKEKLVPSILFIGVLVAFSTIIMAAHVPESYSGKASYGIPSDIDPAARYFIFLHNYYVEKNGPEGNCKYHDILETFANKGFVVISEVRTGKIVPCTYAVKVAGQVRTLLNAGVPAQNITVAGHSKGAVIALCVASQLNNSKINFVLMAGCEIALLKQFNMYPDYKKLNGHILSVYAASDSIAGSCKEVFSKASSGISHSEIEIESDAGHKLFFAPEKIWTTPIINWINSRDL